MDDMGLSWVQNFDAPKLSCAETRFYCTKVSPIPLDRLRMWMAKRPLELVEADIGGATGPAPLKRQVLSCSRCEGREGEIIDVVAKAGISCSFSRLKSDRTGRGRGRCSVETGEFDHGKRGEGRHHRRWRPNPDSVVTLAAAFPVRSAGSSLHGTCRPCKMEPSIGQRPS
ncbi:hypothetical protein E0J21_11715 [Rhizobium laguerreae]|nr:hypothetical protein [Rhizobium laguerreae]TBY08831.1 hypothetical protein E0J21_11715 [Rhizobium laguerreae]